MESLSFAVIIFGILGTVLSGQPEVPCSAPRSPEHGQSFLYQDGRVVKYVCEPGYALQGKEIVRCIEGQWEDPNPTCLEIGADGVTDEPSKDDVPIPPARPLFSWGSDNEQGNEQELNSTDGELPLSDEARVRLLMYPRRRIVTRVQTAKLQSATELEEEEKKRSQDKSDSGSSTTIHVENPPSVVYVKRTIVPGKSEAARRALDEQYRMASLHMTVDNGDDVQLISVPRAAVSVDGKTLQSDEALRQWYWHHYNYPTHASLVQYHNGAPVVMSLTESQLAWINSLHPELRDQYLKDLYVMRADETVEGQRAQALLRRYEDTLNYNYLYHAPYYRRPVSLVDNVASTYDYTCNQAGSPVVTAPSLPNMHVARYDSRKNRHEPHNYYLSAVYQCDPGYYMLDSRFSELYCSRGQWVGMSPVCISNP